MNRPYNATDEHPLAGFDAAAVQEYLDYKVRYQAVPTGYTYPGYPVYQYQASAPQARRHSNTGLNIAIGLSAGFLILLVFLLVDLFLIAH